MSETRTCPSCGRETDAPYCAHDGTATIVRGAAGAAAIGPGTVLGGRYRVTRELGRGGYGAVYAAEHTGTGQPVALKVLKAGDGVGIEGIRRFHKEASVTAALRHPNTVRVFDVGQAEGGALYLAMEHLHGSTLEEELRALAEQGEVYGEKAALRVAEGVLRSLQEAHGAGLVHRDLKPGNIMLADVGEDEPQVKVLDFGIARTRDSSLTDEGTALGTPAYMSPEQCMGAALDGRSDLYSLGVILYRAVAGRCPFEDGNPLTVMYQATHVPAPSLAELSRCDVSPGYVQLTHRALEKKADDRFADARAMREAVLAVAQGLPLPEPPAPEPPPPETEVLEAIESDPSLTAPYHVAVAQTPAPQPIADAADAEAGGPPSETSVVPRQVNASYEPGVAPKRGPPVVGLAVGLVLLIAIGIGLALRGGDDGAAAEPTALAEGDAAEAIAVPAAEDAGTGAEANVAADAGTEAPTVDAATNEETAKAAPEVATDAAAVATPPSADAGATAPPAAAGPAAGAAQKAGQGGTAGAGGKTGGSRPSGTAGGGKAEPPRPGSDRKRKGGAGPRPAAKPGTGFELEGEAPPGPKPPVAAPAKPAEPKPTEPKPKPERPKLLD
ncbi:MAG: serine/threonine protein kinase [Deltaproteobacteria bacterium]|nr:serine/threonine protein kinase [Deltaproteobacteria bacterium]